MTKKTEETKKVMRLTSQTRYSMRHTAVDLKFRARKIKLDKQEKALAQQIYLQIYTEDICRLIQELPAHAFFQRSYIKVVATKTIEEIGPWVSGVYNPHMMHMSLSESVSVFPEHTILAWELPKTLHEKTVALCKQRYNFEVEKAEYLRKVTRFLESCKSCKQMLELLPESYDWLPDKDTGCSDMPTADLAREVIGL